MRTILFLFLVKLKLLFFGKKQVKIPLLLPIYGWLYRHLQPHKAILVRGRKFDMYVHGRDHGLTTSRVLQDEYDSLECKIFEKEIMPGDIVLDLGANVGYFTLWAAQIAGPSGHVFAFEPDPDNFTLLGKNVALNGFHNVTSFNLAAADENGKIKLYRSSYNMGMHRIYPSRFCQEPIDIQVVRLDDFLPSHTRRIDFIKIDTEGAEFAVLQGMRDIIRNQPRLKLLTEFAPCSMVEFGVQPEDYLHYLQELGFTLSHLNEDTNQIEPANLEILLKYYTPENERITNLYGCKKSMADNYISPHRDDALCRQS